MAQKGYFRLRMSCSAPCVWFYSTRVSPRAASPNEASRPARASVTALEENRPQPLLLLCVLVDQKTN